jgi:copper(I)-binding protein
MRPSFRLAAAVAVLVLTSMPAAGRDYTLKDLRVLHPYARPTPPGARTAGAYFTLRNDGREADRLVRVESPVARTVEIHSMTTTDNVMRMRAVDALDVPAGSTVALGPSGYHVMLQELRQPLSVGHPVALTLTFEKSGTIEVLADVEAQLPGERSAHRH